MSGVKGPHPDPLPEGEGAQSARTAPPLPLGEGRGEGLGKAREQGRSLVTRARALRRHQTPAERRLWPALRNDAPGAKCRRQSPLGPYVLVPSRLMWKLGTAMSPNAMRYRVKLPSQCIEG